MFHDTENTSVFGLRFSSREFFEIPILNLKRATYHNSSQVKIEVINGMGAQTRKLAVCVFSYTGNLVEKHM